MIVQKIKVLKKIFVSEESGFSVLKTLVKEGGSGNQIIVGELFDVNEGDFLEVQGNFITHPRFGKQLKVENFTHQLPDDNDGIIKYLSSERFKGIGKKTAEKIVKAFGTEALEIIENSPEKLLELGIKKKIYEEVKKNAHENRNQRDIAVKLAPHNIGTGTVNKIVKKFKDLAEEVLKTNPYCLINEVQGIGFKISDTIAQAYGMEKDNPFRIEAAISFSLEVFEQQRGHLYIEEEELIFSCSRLLNIPQENIEEQLKKLEEKGEIVTENIPHKVYVSKKNYIIEKSIASKLLDIDRSLTDIKQQKPDFQKIAKKLSVQLTQEQEDAVLGAINQGVTVITGGPGTGKTTTIRAIIEAFESRSLKVKIAAPTGRAAKRVEETSHYPASTIHRLLKINPETRTFVHEEKNPLAADAIILDEASMIDTFIFFSLLKAINENRTRLIIIGDKDQLPSVGPGNILRDIINSELFATIFLKRNFRQEAGSLIIDNAFKINEGQMPEFRPYAEDLEFVFIKVNSEEQAASKVVRIIEYYKEEQEFNSSCFQILVPMYRGESGIDNLNREIQDRYNPAPAFMKREKGILKQDDKVMQLKNNYEKEIFNGEQGIIADINNKEKKVFIDFDGYITEYNFDELDEVTPSYAISIHKSQGSEYEMVILVLLPGHRIMLTREIFYTAVTRAKKKIFLISDPATIQTAVSNSSPSERKTLLPLRFREYSGISGTLFAETEETDI